MTLFADILTAGILLIVVSLILIAILVVLGTIK
jgi:hypothetical protein